MLFPIGSKVVAQMRARSFHQFPESANQEKTPFEWVFSSSMWEFLCANPEQRAAFDLYMACRRDGVRPRWFEIYPAGEELSLIYEKNGQDEVLLVDVGSSHGHETVDFQKQHPHLQGRFILQDLPETIKGIRTPLGSIETMPYDFFTPQPVRGRLLPRVFAGRHDSQKL